VGGVRLILPISFSDLNDFPPNLFNARCYLPFVHRFRSVISDARDLAPSGISTAFSVSKLTNYFGTLQRH
jgi:hypothetical protein